MERGGTIILVKEKELADARIARSEEQVLAQIYEALGESAETL